MHLRRSSIRDVYAVAIANSRPLAPLVRGPDALKIGRLALRVVGQAALFESMYLAGTSLASGFHLPLPGSLLGMLLLLCLLAAGVVREEQLDELGRFMLTHLAFFFVPLAVGVMTYSALLSSAGPVLVIALVGSAAAGLAVAGLVGQALARREDDRA